MSFVPTVEPLRIIPPVETHPIDACIMLNIPPPASFVFQEMGERCKKIWASIKDGAREKDFQVPRYFHLSLVSYLARDEEQVRIISIAAQGIFKNYSAFTIGPHPIYGIRIFEDRGKKPKDEAKDYVACQAIVTDPQMNRARQLLDKLNQELAFAVRENGGAFAREGFVPHITIGKILAGHNAFPAEGVDGGFQVTIDPSVQDSLRFSHFVRRVLSPPPEGLQYGERLLFPIVWIGRNDGHPGPQVPEGQPRTQTAPIVRGERKRERKDSSEGVEGLGAKRPYTFSRSVKEEERDGCLHIIINFGNN
jgi:2'-5' RNA ligase